MATSHYIVKLTNSYKGLELVSSHQPKHMLEMFIVKCTNIWPNLILIVPRIQKKQA